jgi:translation initiation factor IF-1
VEVDVSAEYAQVLRMLGQGRLEAQCMDGVKRLCHIRGKMRKKVWVNVGDIVLLGLREYQVCTEALPWSISTLLATRNDSSADIGLGSRLQCTIEPRLCSSSWEAAPSVPLLRTETSWLLSSTL